MAKEKIRLTFVGWDSHQRPVYEDPDGKLWKDTDPRAHASPSLYNAYRNALDGEPDCPFHGEPKFHPKRMTW